MMVDERSRRPDKIAFPSAPGQAGAVPSRLLRALVTVLALAAWFGTQALLGARPDPPESRAREAGTLLAAHDRLLELAAPAHAFLKEHTAWADGLLIVSSAVIDVLALFLLVRGIFGPSIRPLLGLILLFALRQLCQSLTLLPPPGGRENVIWHYPGFPSLLVTYGVTNDLFFSGHTAIAVFGAIELGRLGPRWLPIAAALILFEVATVLLLWAHYTMDVYAGAITAVCMVLVADRLAPPCDRALARLVAASPTDPNKG
jgi:hypothetical protein